SHLGNKFNKQSTITLPDLSLDKLDNNDGRRVHLVWDQTFLSGFGYDSVRIYRNNKQIATTYKSAEYIDTEVALGANYEYKICPIKDGVERLSQTKDVSLLPDGEMEGHLVSIAEDIIVPDTDFTLNNGEETLDLSSNGLGFFREQGIYYGLSASFTASRSENGRVALTKESPKSSLNIIRIEENYQFDRVSNLFNADSTTHEVKGELIEFRLFRTNEAKELLIDKPHFVNVYINEELKRIITFEAGEQDEEIIYLDSLARGDANEFSFKMYHFLDENRVQIDLYKVGEIQSPDYFQVTGFTVIQNTDLFLNDISWQYELNAKIDGFNLYRFSSDLQDSILVETLLNSDFTSMTGDVATYATVDRSGMPGDLYTYRLVPFYNDGEEQIEVSEIKVDINEAFPVWTEDFVTVTYDDANSQFSVEDSNWDERAVDGLVVKMAGEVVNIIPKEDFVTSDATTFSYHWLSYLYTKDERSFSVEVFKFVSDPNNSHYSKEVISEVELKSNDSYHFGARSEGLDPEKHQFVKINLANDHVIKETGEGTIPKYFKVEIGNNTPIFLPGNTKNYAFDPTSGSSQQQVTINAGYRDGKEKSVFNQTFRFNPNTNPDNIASPSNFDASSTGIGKIKLTWDYPDYGLARFAIYRDGNPIDTLDTNLRSYSDTSSDLKFGYQYTYQIKALYNGSESEYLTTVGSKKSRNVLTGVVYDVHAKPIPFAKVTFSPGLQYLDDGTSIKAPNQVFWTDSLGTYWIEDVDIQFGDQLKIAVKSPSTSSTLNTSLSRTFTAQRPGIIRNDFKFDHAYHYYENETGLAKIRQLNAYPNRFDHSITIRWAASSDDVSYYEVYELGIGTLQKTVGVNEVYEYTHENCLPNRKYTFVVQPVYRDVNGVESRPETRIKQVEFALPDVSPVEFLTASVSEKEGKIILDWVHDYENVTGFEVQRLGFSGEQIEKSDGRIALSYDDTNGIPDHQYSYTLVPFVSTENDVYTATSTGTNLLKFPSVAAVSRVETTENTEEYAVDITWEYPETNQNILGVEIMREDDLIATVDYPENSFTDSKGFPNTRTAYGVTTIMNLEDQESDIFRSKTVYDTIWSPTVQPVRIEDVTIDDSRSDSLIVSWIYRGKGVDYFEFTFGELAENLGVPIFTTEIKIESEEGSDSNVYIIKDYNPETKIGITIAAVKSINEEIYRSEVLSFDGTLAALPSISPEDLDIELTAAIVIPILVSG
ncbi:MAG: hypothetical protein AAFY41_02415, partial [Bacteroidota bacterium]